MFDSQLDTCEKVQFAIVLAVPRCKLKLRFQIMLMKNKDPISG